MAQMSAFFHSYDDYRLFLLINTLHILSMKCQSLDFEHGLITPVVSFVPITVSDLIIGGHDEDKDQLRKGKMLPCASQHYLKKIILMSDLMGKHLI